MAALNDLPPDQRAVLQLVLQRGRTYDEIAGMLAIDRAAVRQRALAALDALTPADVLPGPERELVSDYLLGQLPEKVSEQVHGYLQAAEADRHWAASLIELIAPLATTGLPPIPAAAHTTSAASDEVAVGAPLGADGDAAGELHQNSHPTQTRPVELMQSGPTGGQPARHRSSRRGGAILLVITVLLLAVAVTVAGLSGTGSRTGGAKGGGGATTTTQPRTTRTVPTATTTISTATVSTRPQILSRLALSSPTGATATIGIAEVVREGHLTGVVVDAQGMPANSAHNAYGVWLYNSPASARFVGFVPNLVGKSGKLAAEGQLPANASDFHRLLITLETQRHPSTPGEVVLSGPFREHP